MPKAGSCITARIDHVKIIVDSIHNLHEISGYHFLVVDSSLTLAVGHYVVDVLYKHHGRVYVIKVLDKGTVTAGAEKQLTVFTGRYKDIVAALLKKEGLNYGGLPKGLLKFHNYAEGPRTPLEEHLVEGAQTAASARHKTRSVEALL